jgi:hypothetical protein
VIGSGTENGEQHEVLNVCVESGLHKIGVAPVVDLVRTGTVATEEAVYSGDHDGCPSRRGGQRGRVSHIADRNVDRQALDVTGVPRQHPHRSARGGQPGHQFAAQRSGAAGDEDHGV